MDRRQLLAQGVCVKSYLGLRDPRETPFPCPGCWDKIKALELTGEAGSAR
jgi:hypothetical protein